MKNPKFVVQIADAPDREDLVAELWFGDLMWGELRGEADGLMLELYPRPSDGPWIFSLDEALESLRYAKSELVRIGAASSGAVET